MTRTATRTIQDGHWPLIDVASLTFPEPERRTARHAQLRHLGCERHLRIRPCARRPAARRRPRHQAAADVDLAKQRADRWPAVSGATAGSRRQPTSATRVSGGRCPMVARRGTPTPKGPATASTVAPTPVSAPDGVLPSADSHLLPRRTTIRAAATAPTAADRAPAPAAEANHDPRRPVLLRAAAQHAGNRE